MAETPTKSEVIGVALIEDQKELREGLSFLINSTPPFECKHVYATMEEALEGIGNRPPRVALVDIGLPGMSGIEAATRIRDFDFRTVIDNTLVDRLVKEGYFEKVFGPGIKAEEERKAKEAFR